MVRARKALQKAGLWDRGVRPVMNIHDALIFEVPRTIQPAEVIRALQPAVTFPVEGWPKIVADWSFGLRWGSMKKLVVDRAGNVKGIKGQQEREPSSEEDLGAEVSAEEVRAVAARLQNSPPATPAPSAGGSGPLVPDHAQEGLRHQVHTEARDFETSSAAPRTVLIELSTMPDSAQFQRFLSIVAQTTGPNTVLVKTPEGDVPVPETGVSVERHANSISLALGGARVSYAPDSVNASELVAGLSL
jgi:hypothetical protein